MRQAQDADARAAAALNGLSAQATGCAPAANDAIVTAAATAIPSRGTAPADVKKWSGQVGQHVHSTVAQYDPIQVAARIDGPDPTGHAFGGTTFESNPGDPGPWLGWNPDVHSRYWDEKNKALANMGRIIAGQPTH